MRKRMFMGKLTPLDQIYAGDFKYWGGEIISLQHNNSKVSGRVIETHKNEYHLIITEENKMICVEWSENDEKTNLKIFHEYDFGHPNKQPYFEKNTHPKKEVDKPKAGKTYQLTGKPGEKTIENGNTWKESEVNE